MAEGDVWALYSYVSVFVVFLFEMIERCALCNTDRRYCSRGIYCECDDVFTHAHGAIGRYAVCLVWWLRVSFMKYSNCSSPVDCRSHVQSGPAAMRKYRRPIRFVWRTSPGMWPSRIRPICDPPHWIRRAPDADRSCCQRARLERCAACKRERYRITRCVERIGKYVHLLCFAHDVH